MSSDEAERFWDERDKLVSEAPGRWLEMVVTYSFLRKAHRRQRNKASRLRAETSTVKTAQPAADPSRTSKKPARRPRTPLSSRLTRAFTSFGGGVIGGKEGADYVRAWRAELGEVKNPVIKVTHALSNVIGAFTIRITTKTMPRARYVLAAPVRVAPRARHILTAPARITSTLLDTIASSELLAYLLVGAPVLGALIVAGYVLGKMPLAFSTAIAGIPTVSWGVDLWHRRLRKRRRAQTDQGR